MAEAEVEEAIEAGTEVEEEVVDLELRLRLVIGDEARGHRVEDMVEELEEGTEAEVADGHTRSLVRQLVLLTLNSLRELHHRQVRRA